MKSGVEIPSKTIVCTVPSTLPPVIQKLNCAKDKGKLVTNTGLELQGYEGQVWALGDCASVKTVSGKEAPPTAQHAIREAATAATNIAAAIRGSERAQFAFEGLGTLGSLGHGAAVAQILGVKLSGLMAWILWRCIYLMKMPGLNRKARIASDWTLHLLFPPDLAQTKLEAESGIQNQHFEAGDVVFQQGDLGDSVYVIEDRRVRRSARKRWIAKTARDPQARRLFRRNGAAVRSKPQCDHSSSQRDERADHSQRGFRQAAAQRPRLRRNLPRFGAEASWGAGPACGQYVGFCGNLRYGKRTPWSMIWSA